MKRIKYNFFRFAFVFTIIATIFATASAALIAAAATPLTEGEVASLENSLSVTLAETEPPKHPLKCFDASSDGAYAVGYGNYDKKTVCVYTASGTFLRGYCFTCSGDFGIRLEKDKLSVFLLRSDTIVTFDSYGKVVDAQKMTDTAEKTTVKKTFFSTQRTVEGNEYSLHNPNGFSSLFASSYSMLTVKNSDGIITTLYDAGGAFRANFWVSFVAVILFVVIIVFAICKLFVRTRRQKNVQK